MSGPGDTSEPNSLVGTGTCHLADEGQRQKGLSKQYVQDELTCGINVLTESHRSSTHVSHARGSRN